VPLHLRERDMQLRTAFGCMKPAADETYSTLQLLVAVYGSMAKVQLERPSNAINLGDVSPLS
jgi:hypothetical protein